MPDKLLSEVTPADIEGALDQLRRRASSDVNPAHEPAFEQAVDLLDAALGGDDG